MYLLRVGPKGAEIPAVQLGEHEAVDISSLVGDFDPDFFASDGLRRLKELREFTGPRIDTRAVRIGAPVARPGKIVCIGHNYRAHVREVGATPPTEPTVFMKAANCIAGPYDDLLLPPGSTKTDWEAEVGVLIGRQARYLRDESDADACIGGYVISHDVSEREWQMERGGQWVKGKSFEGFNPLGPALVTADEVADPSALHIRTYVNDALRQDGTCSDMIFSARHIVWYLSQFMVLEPGDLVNTGTPSGVGHRMSPPRYLGAGDIVRIEIAGLGSQRTVVAAAQPVD